MRDESARHRICSLPHLTLPHLASGCSDGAAHAKMQDAGMEYVRLLFGA